MKGTGHIYKSKRDLSASARVRWTKRRLAVCLRLNICDFRRSLSARLKKDNPKSTNHKWSCEGKVDHLPQRIPNLKHTDTKNHIILKRFDPRVTSEEHYWTFNHNWTQETLWLIYTAGFEYWFRLGFGLQTKIWNGYIVLCRNVATVQSEWDSDSSRNSQLQEWNWNRNLDLWIEISHTTNYNFPFVTVWHFVLWWTFQRTSWNLMKIYKTAYFHW